MSNNYRMNTPKKGAVRYIIFKKRGTWYGVALEFNIVESADDPDVVSFNLNEAIQGYVEATRKIKGRHDFPFLNQKPSEEYEAMWKNLNSNRPVSSPYIVRNYGVARV